MGGGNRIYFKPFHLAFLKLMRDKDPLLASPTPYLSSTFPFPVPYPSLALSSTLNLTFLFQMPDSPRTTSRAWPRWSVSSPCSCPRRATPRPRPRARCWRTIPGSTSPSTRSWFSPTCWGWSPWQYSECDPRYRNLRSLRFAVV